MEVTCCEVTSVTWDPRWKLHTNIHHCFKETKFSIFNADLMLIVAA
jgi:hypothetical protein